jgi:hypothetical protein
MTERERIGNGIIFLEIARTRECIATQKIYPCLLSLFPLRSCLASSPLQIQCSCKARAKAPWVRDRIVPVCVLGVPVIVGLAAAAANWGVARLVVDAQDSRGLVGADVRPTSNLGVGGSNPSERAKKIQELDAYFERDKSPEFSRGNAWGYTRQDFR